MTWSVRRGRRGCWTDAPAPRRSLPSELGVVFPAAFAYQRPPENEMTMFAYRLNASLPMSLDRQPVEGKDARAEGV